MYIDFSGLFHQSSKDLSGGGRVQIPRDEREWPEEWKTVHYKTYPRFTKVSLPETKPTADFFDLIQKRKSDRTFTGSPISRDALSTLLKYSCGITHEFEEWNPRRAHPSGGARYPLEVYPILFKEGEIPAGVYHYDIKGHALETLWKRPFSDAEIAALSSYEWVQKASGILVLTSIFYRTHMKYGERGYRLALLEAGHIGQNVYLGCAALGVKCCALSGVYDTAIEQLLDVDGLTESVVSVIAFG